MFKRTIYLRIDKKMYLTYRKLLTSYYLLQLSFLHKSRKDLMKITN